MYRPNPLKARLAAGKKSFGVWLSITHPVVAEILALAGYDFLLIDQEHGPGGPDDLIATLQAMSATNVASVVRVPWNDPVYLKRVLDVGVEGVMVPAVETAEQAEQVVRACRYPPRGFRGSAYQGVRASNYGMAADYRETAHDNLVIICQIETRKAVDNLPEICKVDGIDVLFIGPNDLGGSIGRLGDLDHPEAAALQRRAEEGIRAGGRKIGCIPALGRDWQQMLDAGFDMILNASDATLLRDAALAETRAHRKKHP